MSWHPAIAAFALAAFVTGAARAEPTYVPGSRAGIEPLPGLVLSKQGPGFENAEKKVFVQVAELPPVAYGDIERMMFFGDASAGGMIAARPQLMPLASGFGYFMSGVLTGPAPARRYLLLSYQYDTTLLVTADIPDAAGDAYPDDAVRRMLTTASLRPTVPPAEQLATMPFTIEDLAGFKTMATLAPRSAVLLTDSSPTERVDPANAVSMVVMAVPGGPGRASDRGAFAEQALAAMQGYTRSRVVSSEPMRVGGQPGHELRVEATELGSGAAVTIVQWMRFTPGGTLRVVGIAGKDAWTQAYPRFRTVRDAAEFR